MTATFCGLTICPTPEKHASPVPLKSVTVHADVRGWTVGVTAELAYQNTLLEPIECQFVFPLSDKSAVYRLEADVAGKKLYAECRARKEAEEMYKDAVDSGHTGVLLENQSGSPDVFRIMLGNLPANQEAKVTIGFVQPAERDHDGALTFTLPSVLNPRYVPQHMIADPEKMKEQFHFKVPYVAVSEVSYSMTFDAKVCLGVNSKIAEIKSENAAKDVIKVTFENDEKTKATVTLDGKFEQDHDFGLYIMPADPFKPMVFIEPGLQLGSKKNWLSSLFSKKSELPWLSYDIACAWFEPAALEKQSGADAEGDEFWFVVDRSGSMGGSKIEDAKTALILFVKSLPVSCKFNIVGFGSSYSSLFPEGSVNYNDTTVEQALEHARKMDADMGGTEILEPLKFIYSQPKPTESAARRFLVLLTDGEVGNTEEVIALARKNADTSRVFTVGIGEGASTALVGGLARASGGLSEFVRNSQDRLQAKVIFLLKAATKPGAENVALKWDVSGGKLLTKMPDKLPDAVYHGRPLLQYALLERYQGNNLDGYSRLTASIAGSSLDEKLNFNIPSSVVSDSDDVMPLHRLAAKARLLELQDEGSSKRSYDKVKAEMVAISTATGVLCVETAFVAVDLETKQPLKDDKGKPRFIDIERPTVYIQQQQMLFQCGSAPVCKRAGFGGFGRGKMKMAAAPGPMLRSAAPAPMVCDRMKKCEAAMPDPTPMLMEAEECARDVCGDADEFMGGFPQDEMKESKKAESIYSDDMEMLVCRQKLNGSWLMTDDLAKASGSKKANNETSLRQEITAVPSLTGLDDTVVATLIGLAILRRRFSAKREEWELIEEKALGYLKQQKVETSKIGELIAAIANALAI